MMDQLVNKKVLKNRKFIKRITPKVEGGKERGSDLESCRKRWTSNPAESREAQSSKRISW